MTKFILSLISKTKPTVSTDKLSQAFEKEMDVENGIKEPEKLDLENLLNISDKKDYTVAETKDASLEQDEPWLTEESEGELSVDIYQSKDDILVRSTIAGVKPDNLHISLNNDMLTIKGRREPEDNIAEEDYFYHECYWGSFSRTIILPMDVRADQIEAKLKNGVLTIILPKLKKTPNIQVVLTEDEDWEE